MVQDHLMELRRRIINILYFVALFFLIGLYYSDQIVAIISSNIQLIAISPLETIYVRFKVAFIISLAASSPIIFFHALFFVKPGLKKKEQAVIFFIPAFIILFLFGVSFAMLLLNPTIRFLQSISGSILNLWSVNNYVMFVIKFMTGVGIVFEIPLIIIILSKMGFDLNQLSKYRPHLYVAAFILAAIITPPDIITQIILVLPIITLFELTLFLKKF